MKYLLTVGILFILSTSPASAQQIVGIGAGDWIGTGTIRMSPNSDVLRGKCKITTKPTSEITGIEITGKCSSPAGATQIAIRIEERDGNQLAAVLSTKINDVSIQYLGWKDNNQIVLNARDPQTHKGLEYNSKLMIAIESSNAFTLNQLVTQVGSIQETDIVEMNFRKEK